MTGKDLRQKYLDFFKARGHVVIPPAPLVLENDPTTLFTSSGMQPLVPYLLGQIHPSGKRLVDSQPSFRAQDIEEVGDNRHTTFFEMLGNWSLGDYFKKDQLKYFFEFLTDVEVGLGLKAENLRVSIFRGDESSEVRDENGHENTLSLDADSTIFWKDLFKSKNVETGVADMTKTNEDLEVINSANIFQYGVKKNWWSRAGEPSNMPVGEIGGPDSEVFYDFGLELGLHEKSQWKNDVCHPNCDCGRFLEIGNSVFIQYKKIDKKTFEELPNKNVDFGGGLERLVAATNNDPDVFNTDLFSPVLKLISTSTGKEYLEYQKEFRIISDHIKAASFLIKAGVIPSNKLQGYVLRRLIRRSALKLWKITPKTNISGLLHSITSKIIGLYEGSGYFDYKNKHDEVWIANIVFEEIKKFESNLASGLKLVGKVSAFDLYQTYGFPREVIEELYQERNMKFDKEEFEKEKIAHQEKSRSASAGVFKSRS